MKFINHKQTFVHPEDGQEIRALASKWGISMRQLNEAIVDTGSFNIRQLKMHLKQKGVLQFSFSRWLYLIITTTGLTKSAKGKETFT